MGGYNTKTDAMGWTGFNRHGGFDNNSAISELHEQRSSRHHREPDTDAEMSLPHDLLYAFYR